MTSPFSSHAPQVPFNNLTASKSSSSLVEDHLSSPSNIPDNQVDDETRLADDLGPLTAKDIRTDPILASLARKQVYTPPNAQPAHVFRAKPAPKLKEGAGPRLTKAAALRQGVRWETTTAITPQPVTVGMQEKSSKTVSSGEEGRERKEMDFGRTPGHKRDGLSLNVASLSNPTIAPRETKASKLRTGGSVVPMEKRDMTAAAAANKERDRQENLRKRASMILPASLAAPQIAPKANKSSQLRTGGPSPKQIRSATALTATTSVTNVDKTVAVAESRIKAPYEEKVNRRATISGVKSLGAPTIAPRANRSSMLRAPGPSTFVPIGPTASSNMTAIRSRRPSTSSGPSNPAGVRSTRPSTSSGPGESVVGPRPTKASLLRADLGAAKVPFK